MRLSTSLALAALGLAASALPAAAGTLLVPQQFPTIQKALDAARPYDTVLVSAKPKGAVYSEAVTLSTPHVVLQGQGNPVIDGSKLGVVTQDPPFAPFTAIPNGIEIRADHVAVRGLTVQNFGFGDDANSPATAINVGYSVTTGPYSSVQLSFSDIEISGMVVRNNYDGITINGYTASTDPNVPTVPLSGYRLLGDTVSGNSDSAAQILGASGVTVLGSRFTGNSGSGLVVGSNVYGVPTTENALISGNQFMGNTGDGMDAFGDGIQISANEAGANVGFGVYTQVSTYNPAVVTPGSPNPAASAATANNLHDNQNPGLVVRGTQAVLGNALTHNAGYGLFLYFADYSKASGNLISGTTAGGYADDGTGIYAQSGFSYFTPSGFLTISGNAISGNAGDGIFLSRGVGITVSGNSALNNAGIGIHLLPDPFQTTVPNTVTQNVALHNTVFDARDDKSAPDTITYGGQTYVGGGVPTANVWTRNLFGTTDPVGLSK